MANNRLYLVYIPTGRRCCLGKRMMDEWYGAPSQKYMNYFYKKVYQDYLSGDFKMDDFQLQIEDNEFSDLEETDESKYDWRDKK